MSKVSNPTVGAFVINNDATYPWTVFVYVPNDKGGKKIKTKFKATFKHLSSERRTVILDEFRESLKPSDVDSSQQDEEKTSDAEKALSFEQMMLKEVVKGFSGIKNPDGTEFEFNDDNLTVLLHNAWARDALMGAFLTSLKGRSDEGN
jgi:hypothetical protein